MADRLVNENDVLALIDSKIDAVDRLLANPQCRGMNRQLCAAQISVLRTIAEQMKFMPASEYTDADMERRLAALQELADANGWEAANDGSISVAELMSCLG